ncbi:MAG: hypothetical protein ABIK53_08915 [bacterium]
MILNWRCLPGYIGYLQGKLQRREYLKKYHLPTWEDRIDAGQYLTETMGTEETLFVWDSTPVIYFLTNKKPITKYVYYYPLLEEKIMFPTFKGFFSNFAEHRRQLMMDLKSNPPDYIVIRCEPEKIFDEMFLVTNFCNFVNQNYYFLKSFNHALIFKSKDGIKKARERGRETSSIPLEIIKRFAAITQIITKGEETTVTFEPMVNPGCVLRSLKATYPGLVKIDFESITVRFLGQSGSDFVGNVISNKPSGVIDLHMRVKGLPKPVSFVRVKMKDKTWNNQHYGVNPPLKVVRDGCVFDLYFEPPSNWEGKTFNIYFIYEDGSISSTNITK